MLYLMLFSPTDTMCVLMCQFYFLFFVVFLMTFCSCSDYSICVTIRKFKLWLAVGFGVVVLADKLFCLFCQIFRFFKGGE